MEGVRKTKKQCIVSEIYSSGSSVGLSGSNQNLSLAYLHREDLDGRKTKTHG